MSESNIANIIGLSRAEIVSSLEIHTEQCFATFDTLYFPKVAKGMENIFFSINSSRVLLLRWDLSPLP